MGLTNKKEEQLKRQPIIETCMRKARGKDLFVVQTIITEIKPIAYIEKILEGDEEELFELVEA